MQLTPIIPTDVGVFCHTIHTAHSQDSHLSKAQYVNLFIYLFIYLFFAYLTTLFKC
jgi:hypothetical protein